MRIESSVTSVSWIPSEAIKGMTRLPFDMGITHYDDPPPDVIEDLDELLEAGAVRFANRLRGWIDVEDGRIVGHGQEGQGYINITIARLGPRAITFQPTPFPDIRPDPDVAADSVRFIQTAGGKSGIPAPRRVRRKPFVQLSAPLAWTTLALTIHTDGSSDFECPGASKFPRHWIYDHSGKLVAKSGLTDFDDWYKGAFGKYSPWGEEDSPVFVTQAETALERQLSRTIMRGGAKPDVQAFPEGAVLVQQGDPGNEIYLILDGIVDVEVDGEKIADVGPGAIVGERAVLEGGSRTATLKAVTACKAAVAGAEIIDRDALAELSRGHRREEGSG